MHNFSGSPFRARSQCGELNSSLPLIAHLSIQPATQPLSRHFLLSLEAFRDPQMATLRFNPNEKSGLADFSCEAPISITSVDGDEERKCWALCWFCATQQICAVRDRISSWACTAQLNFVSGLFQAQTQHKLSFWPPKWIDAAKLANARSAVTPIAEFQSRRYAIGECRHLSCQESEWKLLAFGKLFLALVGECEMPV